MARACSGAEFVDGRRSVRINRAECLNPDEPTFMQEYENHYTILPL
ncbi:MAG: hypothetical protein K2O24_09015 [Muribaculaceae bacterium]|nr:hypothetical protein [Muribaculaceae bacterium]